MTSEPFGVSFLADDGAYEWAVALLESLRRAGKDTNISTVDNEGTTALSGRRSGRFV